MADAADILDVEMLEVPPNKPAEAPKAPPKPSGIRSFFSGSGTLKVRPLQRRRRAN